MDLYRLMSLFKFCGVIEPEGNSWSLNAPPFAIAAFTASKASSDRTPISENGISDMLASNLSATILDATSSVTYKML